MHHMTMNTKEGHLGNENMHQIKHAWCPGWMWLIGSPHTPSRFFKSSKSSISMGSMCCDKDRALRLCTCSNSPHFLLSCTLWGERLRQVAKAWITPIAMLFRQHCHIKHHGIVVQYWFMGCSSSFSCLVYVLIGYIVSICYMISYCVYSHLVHFLI